MKYLKLYEEHNQYFWEISEEEFKDLEYGMDNFKEEEISILKNITNSTALIILPSVIRLYNIKDRNIKNAEADIYKLKDEWYIVETRKGGSKYYKCDQFDGLTKCIEDTIGI